ncbi:hypothetical protein D0T25_15395 [Duganella sp. BJB488]|nr:hypothetical protein D0T26_13580 [Duganella sp. BJB489]RFP21256.1 hypothetical protein D0T25_15395 [Duganella sp. BJB488]RFP33398.1 hypothetical protein D0T24_19090 [Duganella sp. BJB480]
MDSMINYHICYKLFEIRSFSTKNERNKWQGRWEIYRDISRIDSSTVVTEFETSTEAGQNALAICCQLIDEGRIRNPALLATGY